jgi:signal transduction histidine kinase
MQPPNSTRFRLSAGVWPFTRIVPSIVVICGLVAAIATTAIGVNELRLQSDKSASLRSELLAQTLAARLAGLDHSAQQLVARHASQNSQTELLVTDSSGVIQIDDTDGPPHAPGIVQLLRIKSGETQTLRGRARFFAARLPHAPDRHVIVFVAAPDRPVSTESLVRLVGAFTGILLGVAALVAFALSRDAHADISYVTRRIVHMAKPETNPAGTLIPIRSIDQVGATTLAFNNLVERFTRAQQSYVEDLELALTLERDKSAFLAALSHELKTPLNVILGFADVLLSEVEGPLSADAKENLETVRRSGLHLKALIKDILDLSGLESGELTLTREFTDVYSIADDVLKEHRVSAQEKQLELSLTGRSAQAWADPVRVRQIIGNLVSNAIKFTQKGAVRVSIEPREEHCAIIVTDTGPGIARGEQSAIFDDYTQVGDVRSRGAGTGLGLAITRRLVRMHDGQVSVESTLGVGSRFVILLPKVRRGRSLSRARITPTEAPRRASQ